MNSLRLFFSLLLPGFALLSCSLGQSSNQSSVPYNGKIEIGYINPIPYSNDSTKYALLPIHNKSNKTIFLSAIETVNHNKNHLNSSYLDAIDCNTITPNKSCYLKLYANNLDGYLLHVTYKTANNDEVQLRQIINFSNNLPENNGIIISNHNSWANSGSSLSIPILINQPYKKIEAKIGSLTVPVTCSNQNTDLHNMCTVVVPGSNISNGKNIITLNLYDFNQLQPVVSYSSPITINKQIAANIVSSVVTPIITPTDGSAPVSITLLNNGIATATSLTISGSNPIQIQNNNCNTSLNTNQSCSFQINASATISGQSSIIISYNDSNRTQILPINVSYISAAPSPTLTLTPNGSFANTAINQGNVYLTINVQNTGNTILQNLQFNDVNKVNSAMSSFVIGSSCMKGQNLAVGESCSLILSYNPTTAQAAGTVTLIVSSSYYDQSGQIQTYSNSSLTIPYSAVTGAIFKAAGDFGMILTSPAGASGTWTASVDSPFATTSISANSLIANSSFYIMTMSNGLVKYSTTDGLFWKTSQLGGSAAFNSSTCSIAYDGTYYYTCGTVSTAFSSKCTTTGRGCVIRTNDPSSSSGWTTLFTPAQAVPINDIFYFNKSGSIAYVATLANTTSNTGLATSNDGLTWKETSSGQSASTYNNFTPVTFNSVMNMLTAWNSVGYSSNTAITAVGNTWIANTITRPANSKVTSAIFQNSNYILSLANGNIYTADAITTSYTQSSTNTTPLNRIIYINNLGSGLNIYLAVGNNGLILNSINPSTSNSWGARTLQTGQATVPNLTGIFYAGSIWVTGVSTILKSLNVTSWITPGLQSITKNGSGYLAVDNQAHIYASTDSVSWTKQSNRSGNLLNGIYCAATNLCFAVGEKGTIVKTTNGGSTPWFPSSSITTNNLQEITCSNSTCVIVGGNSTANSGTILFSNDYTNWSLITNSLATTNLNSVTYYNNTFIAVGESGAIFSSTNGINWKAISSGTTQNLNSIDCASNSGCVAVGNSGTILFSLFGTSWAAQTSGTTNDLLSVAYNGVFAAVGKGGVLRYSATGTGTWSSATFPTTSSATNNLNAVISN